MEKIHGESAVIVGGGISGLIAATLLQRHGLQVTVLDKGRGIGGRLATRRINHDIFGEGIFDYGAQFFTVRDPLFKKWVSAWKKENIVQKWSDNFPGKNTDTKKAGNEFYRGSANIRDIAKRLAANLNVRTSTRVTNVSWKGSQWHVQTEKNKSFSGDILMMTPPVPQILELLKFSKIRLSEVIEAELDNVTYQRCIAALILLKDESNIPEPGGVWMGGEPLHWIADNSVKGISPEGHAVTILAGPEFSLRHWDWDDDKVLERIMEASHPWIRGKIAESQIHRWKYSQPIQPYIAPFQYISDPGPMMLAGDGFVGSRVESAVLSGIHAAEFIKSNLE